MSCYGGVACRSTGWIRRSFPSLFFVCESARVPFQLCLGLWPVESCVCICLRMSWVLSPLTAQGDPAPHQYSQWSLKKDTAHPQGAMSLFSYQSTGFWRPCFAVTKSSIGPVSQFPARDGCLEYPVCGQQKRALVLEQVNQVSGLCWPYWINPWSTELRCELTHLKMDSYI